jgi:hypothetical protein
MTEMRLMRIAAAALALIALPTVAALAEGKKIDCSDTRFEFNAPGYVTDCKDASQDSIDVSGGTIKLKIQSLHAVSQADSTFLDVVSDHILGNSGIFYRKSSLQSNITRYYNGDFNDWGDEEDVGDYTVKHVTADFKDGNDPMDCLAFQLLGARRYEGIAGMTVGLTCSMDGRDKAMNALKHLAGEAN